MEFLDLSNTSAIWRFPSNNYGEEQGVSNSGVEGFSNCPNESLAREIVQNSLDAKRSDSSCVRVEFHTFEIPVSSIPGINDLKDAIIRSEDYWKDNQSNKTKAFFKRLRKAVENEKCCVMRISDFNTTGLYVDTEWKGLIKRAGASGKHGGNTLGSFGQGKYATFGCSDLRTVFYSTYDELEKEACQGVARLTTFERADGETTSGVWFFGEEKNEPVYKQMKLDPSFSREKGNFGTDVFIIGYRMDADDEWKENIILSVLSSFMVAIDKGNLEVIVDDVQINSLSLPNIMKRYESYYVGQYKVLPAYFHVLRSEETIWTDLKLNGRSSGDILRLGLLKTDDKTPKSISMCRGRGMKIKEITRLAGQSPFTGICIIIGDSLNEDLLELEPPEHNDWYVARAEQRLTLTQAKALLKEINASILSCIKNNLSLSDNDSVEIVGLGQLIPDVGEDPKQKATEESLSDEIVGITNSKERIINPKNKTTPELGKDPVIIDSENGDLEAQGMGNDDYYYHKGGHIHHHTEDPQEKKFDQGEDPKQEKTYRESMFSKFSHICVNKNSGSHVLIIIPTESANDCKIKLFQAAEINNYDLPIIDAKLRDSAGNMSPIHVNGNTLEGLNLEAGKEYRIMLNVDYHDYCTMEKRIYVSEE